jgi:hypothetical protein
MNVLYSIRPTDYHLTVGWQLLTLKLSMKR